MSIYVVYMLLVLGLAFVALVVSGGERQPIEVLPVAQPAPAPATEGGRS